MSRVVTFNLHGFASFMRKTNVGDVVKPALGALASNILDAQDLQDGSANGGESGESISHHSLFVFVYITFIMPISTPRPKFGG